MLVRIQAPNARELDRLSVCLACHQSMSVRTPTTCLPDHPEAEINPHAYGVASAGDPVERGQWNPGRSAWSVVLVPGPDPGRGSGQLIYLKHTKSWRAYDYPHIFSQGETWPSAGLLPAMGSNPASNARPSSASTRRTLGPYVTDEVHSMESPSFVVGTDKSEFLPPQVISSGRGGGFPRSRL